MLITETLLKPELDRDDSSRDKWSDSVDILGGDSKDWQMHYLLGMKEIKGLRWVVIVDFLFLLRRRRVMADHVCGQICWSSIPSGLCMLERCFRCVRVNITWAIDHGSWLGAEHRNLEAIRAEWDCHVQSIKGAECGAHANNPSIHRLWQEGVWIQRQPGLQSEMLFF